MLSFSFYFQISIINVLSSAATYTNNTYRRVTRNPQGAGAVLGKIANGGLGAKPPPVGDWGFGGKALSRRRHEGLGVEPPALENFAFSSKNSLILGLF